MKCTHTLTLLAVGLALCCAATGAHGAKLSISERADRVGRVVHNLSRLPTALRPALRPAPEGGDTPPTTGGGSDGPDDGPPPRPLTAGGASSSISFAGSNPFEREYDSNTNPTPAPTHENESLRSGCSACNVSGCGEGNCDGVMYCGADGGGTRFVKCTAACPACPTPAPSSEDDDEDAIRASRNDVRRSMLDSMRAAFDRLRVNAAKDAKAAYLGCVETTGCDYDYTWFANEAKKEAFLAVEKLVETPEGASFTDLFKKVYFDEPSPADGNDDNDTDGIRLRENSLPEKVYWDEPKEVDGDGKVQMPDVNALVQLSRADASRLGPGHLSRESYMLEDLFKAGVIADDPDDQDFRPFEHSSKVDGDDDTAGIRLRESAGPEEKALPGFGSFLPKASGAREFEVPEADERVASMPEVPTRSAPTLRGGNSGFLAKEEDAAIPSGHVTIKHAMPAEFATRAPLDLGATFEADDDKKAAANNERFAAFVMKKDGAKETEPAAVDEAKPANTTTIVAIAAGSAVALLALGAVAWRYRPHRRDEAAGVAYATQQV